MNELVAAALSGNVSPTQEWERVNCPVCEERRGTPDKKASLAHNTRTGWWKCWRCGAKGRLKNDHRGPHRAPKKPSRPPLLPMGLPHDTHPVYDEEAAASYTLQPALQFLASRNVPRHVAQAARLGACISGFYADRLIIPVRRQGETVGFVARTWAHADRAYLYPKGFRREAMLNGDALQVRTDVPVLLVEGAFDALAHWPNAVACLGKPTAAQLEQVARAQRPVIVALDADAWREGMAAASRLRLHGAKRVGWMRLPPGEDPDSARGWVKKTLLTMLDTL